VRKLFSSRRGRIAVIGTAVAIVLGSGGAAYAYFTATGSGTGQATVGTTGTWQVAQNNTSGTIYPGSGASTIVFDVKNTGTGDQQYSNATVALANDGSGNITVGGAPVPGCLASWFTASVSNDPAIHTNVAGGATVQVTTQVSMPADQTDNQNPCQGKSPDVTLTVG
jgi:hypothetical protein